MADVMKNLFRDSDAADSAGLSYGQYMARKYENGYSPQPRKEPEPEPNCECRQCNGKFYNPTKHKRVFCCDACRHAYYGRKSREAKRKKISETVAG